MARKLAERRIGPKMLDAAAFVAANPGTVKMHAAWAASPWPGSSLRSCGLQYGYAAVNRALGAGLIEDRGQGMRYALHVTDKGRAALSGRS